MRKNETDCVVSSPSEMMCSISHCQRKMAANQCKTAASHGLHRPREVLPYLSARKVAQTLLPNRWRNLTSRLSCNQTKKAGTMLDARDFATCLLSFRLWAAGHKMARVAACPILLGIILVATVRTAYPFTEAQVKHGKRVYKRQCARCHGPDGKGKDNQFKGLRAPELIGSTALPCLPRPYQKIRQSRFRTAEDVYAFASAAMPADEPAIFDADEYWAVIAYLLEANGRKADETPLDKASSARIVLHADCPSGPERAQP
jgi:mono/diheme cytochrome c family protein